MWVSPGSSPSRTRLRQVSSPRAAPPPRSLALLPGPAPGRDGAAVDCPGWPRSPVARWGRACSRRPRRLLGGAAAPRTPEDEAGSACGQETQSEGPAEIQAWRQERRPHSGSPWFCLGLTVQAGPPGPPGPPGWLGNQDALRLLGGVGPREGGLGQRQARPDGGLRCLVQGLRLHRQEEQPQPRPRPVAQQPGGGGGRRAFPRRRA